MSRDGSLLARGYGERPEREAEIDLVAMHLRRLTWMPRPMMRRRMLEFPERVSAAAKKEGVQALSSRELAERLKSFRLKLRRRGVREELLPTGFALIQEVSARVLGMRHRDVQLMAGWALVHGALAEVETGEGKTLAATLAAGVAAWAGLRVHVITSNDYLAERDATHLAPLYDAIGLKAGCVLHGIPRARRRQAYACEITYASAKELAFDYLRDRLALGGNGARRRHARRCGQGTVMRGLVYGIVDEADDILIDEARTPLIISEGGASEDEANVRGALEFARRLESRRHFRMDADRHVELTSEGERMLDQWTRTTYRGSKPHRFMELAVQAVAALHGFKRDKDYIVRDGSIVIVDEHSGRGMADRSWSRGLHQLIEAKEGCELSEAMRPRVQSTYQEFFRRYLNLCGMTGTAWEVRRELWMFYRLPVLRVPPHCPSRCVGMPPRVFMDMKGKEQSVVMRVEEVQRLGRPVLVGTASVKSSERLAAAMAQCGIKCRVLNARQDADEAEVVKRAGRHDAVTVATSMAGRGTDIPLDDVARENGGLHVILTEMHDSSRVDRQLAGRAARHGDPGSYEMMLSLEDDIWMNASGTSVLRPVIVFLMRGIPWGGRIVLRLMRYLQKRIEKRHFRIRCRLVRHQKTLGDLLSFSWEEAR